MCPLRAAPGRNTAPQAIDPSRPGIGTTIASTPVDVSVGGVSMKVRAMLGALAVAAPLLLTPSTGEARDRQRGNSYRGDYRGGSYNRGNSYGNRHGGKYYGGNGYNGGNRYYGGKVLRRKGTTATATGQALRRKLLPWLQPGLLRRVLRPPLLSLVPSVQSLLRLSARVRLLPVRRPLLLRCGMRSSASRGSRSSSGSSRDR